MYDVPKRFYDSFPTIERTGQGVQLIPDGIPFFDFPQ